MDLFDHALDRDDGSKPLPERLRPRRFEEFVGQEHVLGPASADCGLRQTTASRS